MTHRSMLILQGHNRYDTQYTALSHKPEQRYTHIARTHDAPLHPHMFSHDRKSAPLPLHLSNFDADSFSFTELHAVGSNSIADNGPSSSTDNTQCIRGYQMNARAGLTHHCPFCFLRLAP